MTDEIAAPLLSLPGAAFGAETRAFWYEGEGGLRLRAALCPARDPVGSVVLNPGRTEPIEKYVEVVAELNARGFTVLIHDWRGQGRSTRLLADALRGHADGFDPFLADFRRLLDRCEDDLPGPRLLLANSMGGALSLAALARGEARFSAALLSAPMLGLKAGDRPAWQARLAAGLMRRLGRGGDYVLGGATDPFAARFETHALTHDRARFDRALAHIQADRALGLGNVTWGWLSAAYRLTGQLSRPGALETIAVPVVILAAGEERLVSNAASQAMAARLPKGRYVEVPGAFHEIMMETDALRAPFWAEFDRLAASVGAKPRDERRV